MKFYIDQFGSPKIDVSPKDEALAGFLESDVQASLTSCHEILSVIKEIQLGIINSCERTGNSYTADIKHDVVSIVNNFSDSIPVCNITIEEFKSAVQDWLNIIESLLQFQQLSNL